MDRIVGQPRLAIVIFVSEATADEVTGEGVIAKLSRAAFDYFNKRQPRIKSR